MDVELNITLLSGKSGGDSSARLICKSLTGKSKIIFGIEAEGQSSEFSISMENGKPCIKLDSSIIRQIADDIAFTVSQAMCLTMSMFNLKSGDISLESSRALNISSDQLLNLASGIALNIGAKQIDINGLNTFIQSTLMELIVKNILTITCPRINLTGQVNLGTGNLRPIARLGDTVVVNGVETGKGSARGQIMSGGSNMSS